MKLGESKTQDILDQLYEDMKNPAHGGARYSDVVYGLYAIACELHMLNLHLSRPQFVTPIPKKGDK